MWVTDRYKLTQALVVDPLYLQHSYSESAIDYRHWGIPLSRRFRSLKLWFVIRNFGVSGLQEYVRNHCRLAKVFEAKVEADTRFRVMNDVKVGLVCFRLFGSNQLNQKLLTTINASGKLHMVPASVNDYFVIRFCVCAQSATEEDIDIAWKIISEIASEVLKTMQAEEQSEDREEDDVVKAMKKKSSETLEHKRSFFVRMVSDPKLYNPKIVKIDRRQKLQNMGVTSDCSDISPMHSWVSWPLAVLVQGVEIDEVSMRFRNWNTTFSLSPHQASSSSSTSSSPRNGLKALEDENETENVTKAK
eukprot:TRINITY_DN35091_c0_g1_i1.p1 TRINITY_DN35091_c0_g1~~TRINITY_DN35091_c0_g1_i1.p1  ORF type:complete len:317 (-),score=105.83 TRINITY_DN35091_c0_g1_i1:73-981(-)